MALERGEGESGRALPASRPPRFEGRRCISAFCRTLGGAGSARPAVLSGAYRALGAALAAARAADAAARALPHGTRAAALAAPGDAAPSASPAPSAPPSSPSAPPACALAAEAGDDHGGARRWHGAPVPAMSSHATDTHYGWWAGSVTWRRRDAQGREGIMDECGLRWVVSGLTWCCTNSIACPDPGQAALVCCSPGGPPPTPRRLSGPLLRPDPQRRPQPRMADSDSSLRSVSVSPMLVEIGAGRASTALREPPVRRASVQMACVLCVLRGVPRSLRAPWLRLGSG